MLKVGFDMQWELKQVDDTEWIQDDSGYYTLIHYVKDNTVRIDFMDRDDMPFISFQGTADNVRKAFMQWIDNRISQKTSYSISCEHASYIGAELARAALLKDKYIQD